MPTVQQLNDSLLSIKTVSDALDYPTIKRELKAYGAAPTIARMYAEISRGLSAFNVKQNMTAEQIEMFIEDFIDLYTYESIADLRICLKNARVGKYGKHYQSIDGLLLMNWFKQYLDDKAQARAKRAQKEKSQDFEVLKYVDPTVIETMKNAIKPEDNEPG